MHSYYDSMLFIWNPPPSPHHSRSLTFFSLLFFFSKIVFTQMINNDRSETTVEVQLTSSLNSSGHKWHVHMSNVTDNDCLSTGGHYNPFNICTTSDCLYSMRCGKDDLQSLCELGDLASKSEALSFSPGMMTRLFYTDTQLPLSGMYSIEGRSIVIHAALGGTARIACSTIALLSVKTAEAQFNLRNVTGVVSMAQPYHTEPVTVQVKMSNLRGSTAQSLFMATLPAYIPVVPGDSTCTGGRTSMESFQFADIWDCCRRIRCAPRGFSIWSG